MSENEPTNERQDEYAVAIRRAALPYDPDDRQARALALMHILNTKPRTPGPDGIVPQVIDALTMHVDEVAFSAVERSIEASRAMAEAEVERLRAEIRDRESERADLRDRVTKAEAKVEGLWRTVDIQDRLLGSHVDGHRCTCTMVDPGVYHGYNMHPPEWEQDPWCPTHPDADYIRQQFEKAEAQVARVEALADDWVRTTVHRWPSAEVRAALKDPS